MIRTSLPARIRRLIGAAGLATLVAAGPLAGPASAASLSSFSGSGTGYALRVTLDVTPLLEAVPALQPVLDTVWASVPGQSGAFPGVIDQTFIKTTSEADGDITKSRSVLGEGLLDLDAVEATTIGQTTEKVVQSVGLPSAELPLIDAAIGTLKAAVSEGPGVNASGALANVGVGIPTEELAPAVLDDLVTQLTATISDLTDDLTANLTPLLETSGLSADLADQLAQTIDTLAGSLPVGSPVLDGLASGLGLGGVTDLTNAAEVTPALESLLDVDALVTQVTDLLDASLLNGALADLTGLVNFTKAAKSGDGVAVADSVAQLKSLNVLGGLLDVGVLNLTSHSEAAGTEGSAKNTSDCSIADVKVGGDTLGIALDGSNIFVNGQAVPVVGDLIAQVEGVVSEVLDTVGIDVGLCETAQVEAEADGTAAAQRVSALRVEVAPLGLFNLVIDPTVETSVAAAVAAPADESSLPRTGAGTFATVLTGIGLVGATLLIRRRLITR